MRAETMGDLGPDLTPEEIRAALARPPDFGWHGDRDETFRTWALGPTIQHRESGLVDQSNAAVLQRWLTEASDRGEIEPDSWRVVTCRHWAVGWVEHLSYRVIGDDGTSTRVARWVRRFLDGIEEYPIADESDYSERQIEAEIRNVAEAARWCRATRDVIDSLPEGWEAEVASLLSDRGDLTDGDDHGGCPRDDDALIDAFRSLGYLPPETEESD